MTIKQESKKIRIVVLVDKDIPTDHSFIQGVLEKSLPKENCEVTFVGYKNDLLPIHPRNNVLFKTVKSRSQNFFIRKLDKIYNFTKEIKKAGPFDVLFTRNDPVYLIIAWWLKLTNVVSLHFHQISHLQAFSTTEKKTIFKIKSFGDLLLRKVFLKYADRILVISKEMKKFLDVKWPNFTSKYMVCPLGVEVSDFMEIKPYNDRKYELVYIGTLAGSRRIDVILDALKIYNDKFGELKLHVWGESHNKKDNVDIKKYANTLGLGELTNFYGKIPRQEVLGKLKDTKIGLSTIPCDGILNQISPTKLMEYLAAGCCVIATKGIPDQKNIIEGAYGNRLINFDANEIAEAIHTILSDDILATKLSKLGRDHIFKERSYLEMAKELRIEINLLLKTS